jgi:hypothetical protein
MQAFVLEGFGDIENLGGAYCVPVQRSGKHSGDLILSRETAQLLVYALMNRIADDDERPSNIVSFRNPARQAP